MSKRLWARIADILIAVDYEEDMSVVPEFGFVRGFAVDVEDGDEPCLCLKLREVEEFDWSADSILGDGVKGCRTTTAPVEAPEDIYTWALGYRTENGEQTEVFRVEHERPAEVAKVEYRWKNANAGGNEIMIEYTRGTQDFDLVVAPMFYMLMSRIMLRYDGLLVHCSTVNHAGEGYLFTAVSGTGKSTMAGLWEKRVGAGIINDDMIVLRSVEGEVRAYNVPMKFYNQTPKNVVLKRVYFIEQSKDDWTKPVSVQEGALRLLGNSIHQTFAAQDVAMVMKNVGKIAQHIEPYRLGFKLSTDIVDHILKEVECSKRER